MSRNREKNLNNLIYFEVESTAMTTDKVHETADEEQQPAIVPEKKTLKDVVLEGLEEKGKGKDLWLW